MEFDFTQLKDIRTWLAPLVTLTIGITGFIITTRARKKRFSNERISTLKDIQSLPALISDEKNIKEAVSDEMRSSVLNDLTGIRDIKEAEIFLQIISSTNLDTKQRILIRKSLFAMSLAKDEKKEDIIESENTEAIEQTVVNHRYTDIILNIEKLTYSSYLKCLLMTILAGAIIFMLGSLMLNFAEVNYVYSSLSSILGIAGMIWLAYIDISYVWPGEVDKVNELSNIINNSAHEKTSKELAKLDSYIT